MPTSPKRKIFKHYEVLGPHNRVEHTFRNKQPRPAALKAATKGFKTIRLREKGTNKVHVFKGGVDNTEIVVGGVVRTKVPWVEKLRTDRL